MAMVGACDVAFGNAVAMVVAMVVVVEVVGAPAEAAEDADAADAAAVDDDYDAAEDAQLEWELLATPWELKAKKREVPATKPKQVWVLARKVSAS
jgi:hypothetical protein